MPKAPDAFRTISEVADWLGVQTHVLRFWESKFAQVKPIKRAGGRRYYRPTDMLLLGGLKKLLHEDGLTIKGAQKVLREHGQSYVADQSQPLDELTMAVISGTAQSEEADAEEIAAAEMTLTDLLDTQDALEDAAPQADDPAVETATEVPSEPEATALPEVEAEAAPGETEAETPEAAASDPEAGAADTAAVEDDPPDAGLSPQDPEPGELASPDAEPEEADHAVSPQTPPVKETPVDAPKPEVSEPTIAEAEIPEAEDLGQMPSFRARARPGRAPEAEAQQIDADAVPAEIAEPLAETAAETPQAKDADDTSAAPLTQEDPPKARQIDVPPVPEVDDISAEPSVLTSVSRIRQISPEHAREIKPLLARLTRLRASMDAARAEQHKD